MSKPVVEVQVRAMAATSGGCAVFLGNEDKVFVMIVDQSIGTAITMFMQGTKKERPIHFVASRFSFHVAGGLIHIILVIAVIVV